MNQLLVAIEKGSIKITKTALEHAGLFDKTTKIFCIRDQQQDQLMCLDGESIPEDSALSVIPTTCYFSPHRPEDSSSQIQLLKNALDGLPARDRQLPLTLVKTSSAINGEVSQWKNPVAFAVREWLREVIQDSKVESLIAAESWTYQIYQPMLLLGPTTFKSQSWQDLVKDGSLTSLLPELYVRMCAATNCSHLAINAPIPLNNLHLAGHDKLNTLRSPSGLLPLHGDFGSATAGTGSGAFLDAFWATTTQNGIVQTFAPVHTMFSRGNIKEKTRILRLAEEEAKPYTAIDLYAGIGYFAFSYAKAGAAVVLGWEINGWSVEGFRRGATSNGWPVRVVSSDESDSISTTAWLDTARQSSTGSPSLVIFQQSNESAALYVENAREHIPPVRHVNCGYLPSSKDSWLTAIKCLDPVLGGTIHAHENVGVADIESRRVEVETIYTNLAHEVAGNSSLHVRCRHVERVKSYAPGVIHCVFDVEISRHSVVGTGHA